MTMKKLCVGLSSMVAFINADPALASDYLLNIVAGTEQNSTYNNGVEQIDDVQPNTVVRIVEPREPTPKQSSLLVLVLNRGSEPLNFGPENVTIRFADGSTVAMLEYNELMRRQRKHEKTQRFFMALGAGARGASAGQAGYNSGTYSYSGQTTGNYGATPYSATTSGRGTYSGYDSEASNAAQAQANAETSRDVAQLRSNQQADRGRIAQVMQTTTVAPGNVFGGIVQFEVPKPIRSSKVPVPVTIEITVRGETHYFRGTITKQ